jgi:luciferase family oxidoreductase group 1
MLPLSILDLSVVTTATKPAAALRNSIDLARHADRLGFTRYWLAEHHNLSSVASPAPDLMIGQIAAVTTRLRVGSGGVMLPNHAPLVVAERFKMLEALFPGRIDLGLGRAPGTDPATAYALRQRLQGREGDDFLERLHELTLWETREFPAGHPFNNVVAMPDDAPLPPLWLLGSSDYSAQLSAQLGMGFAFAHHFASHDAVEALTHYRRHFRPSPWRAAPYGILAIAVVAAETDAEAERLATSMDLNRLRRDRGQYSPLASPEEAQAYPYTEGERASIARNRARLFVGSPAMVMSQIQPLIAASEADEVMIVSAIFDHEARKRSYSLLAQAFQLQQQAAE